MLLHKIPWPLLVVTTLLSGCVQGGDEAPAALDADLPIIRIPVGAYDATGPGPWYALGDRSLEAPARVLLVNDDSTMHRILAMTVAPEPHIPAWARHGEQGHGGDADGHDHGGPLRFGPVTADGPGHGGEAPADGQAGESSDPGVSAGHAHGETLFDVTLETGESTTVLLGAEGTVMLHCHPHPWMEAEVEILPPEPRPYPVEVVPVERARTASGTVEGAGAEHEVAWSLPDPDVALVQATLTWDDAEDDAAVGAGANAPDTLRLRLVAPDGTVVAERDAEARAGRLEIRHEPEAPAWPDAVEGAGRGDAAERLVRERPEDLSWSGTWTVRVGLVAAPGLVPAEAGVPGDDGRQSWSLDLHAVHEYARLA